MEKKEEKKEMGEEEEEMGRLREGGKGLTGWGGRRRGLEEEEKRESMRSTTFSSEAWPLDKGPSLGKTLPVSQQHLTGHWDLSAYQLWGWEALVPCKLSNVLPVPACVKCFLQIYLSSSTECHAMFPVQMRHLSLRHMKSLSQSHRPS